MDHGAPMMATNGSLQATTDIDPQPLTEWCSSRPLVDSWRHPCSSLLMPTLLLVERQMPMQMRPRNGANRFPNTREHARPVPALLQLTLLVVDSCFLLIPPGFAVECIVGESPTNSRCNNYRSSDSRACHNRVARRLFTAASFAPQTSASPLQRYYMHSVIVGRSLQ